MCIFLCLSFSVQKAHLFFCNHSRNTKTKPMSRFPNKLENEWIRFHWKFLTAFWLLFFKRTVILFSHEHDAICFLKICLPVVLSVILDTCGRRSRCLVCIIKASKVLVVWTAGNELQSTLTTLLKINVINMSHSINRHVYIHRY